MRTRVRFPPPPPTRRRRGNPAAVFFATGRSLVKPLYRSVNTLSSADAAYIAGLIDGEGTITLTREHHNEGRRLVASITNTERDLLRFVWGAGRGRPNHAQADDQRRTHAALRLPHHEQAGPRLARPVASLPAVLQSATCPTRRRHPPCSHAPKRALHARPLPRAANVRGAVPETLRQAPGRETVPVEKRTPRRFPGLAS